jgi:outer membrane protein TolC
MLALVVFSLCGCSRQFFRLRADKEVKYLVTQKSNDPRWELSNFTIGMDPRARYFDPTNPDCPPMPYDDPASHRYMHCVAGRKQWPCWHMNGDWYYLENPRWKELLGQYNEVTEDGAIKLSMNGAVCLAQVHSPNYRQQIETIYLSALDVSTERFRFDVQFFGNSETVFEHQGALRSPLGEQNTLTQRTAGGFARGFSAGGELLVGIANSIVWQFAGPDTNVTTSLLNFSLIQPLLRNGGRAFVMEQLTIAERALLANLRAFQYYRQGFYTNVTLGAGNVPGPQRQGGFFGGTGLTGFSGQGAGGFGGVGSGTFGIQGGGGGAGGGAATGAGFVGGGAGQVGGFIGLLQQKQQVANLQSNLNALVGTLGLLEASFDAGLIDIVQVDQFRQNIETTRANLLQSQIGYQNALDSFKVGTLGLPPDTDIELDDQMLEQFQFLDPNTVSVQQMIDRFVRTIGDLPEEPTREQLASAVEAISGLRERLGERFQSAHSDMEAMDAAVPEREERMSAEERATFADQRDRMKDRLEDVETRFTDTEGVLQNVRNSLAGDTAGSQVLDRLVSLGVALSGLTQELALVRARARLEAVTIPHIELESDRALEIARANRLDWMNNRASLVDQWRLITYNANLLKAGLNLTFDGDVGTVGNNPVNFSGRNGSLRVGVRFDAPFARRLERNDYRSALIFYQQQRRALYQYQDGVHFSLRALLRQLAQLEANMGIQRRAVEIAVRRVDKTREDLNKPPAPVLPGQPIEALGPTVGQNLIFALNDLTGAQNNLMSVVLNYYETRMLLYRTLGILELDDCGMWIDRPIDEAAWLTEDQCPMPPNVPIDWMQDADVDPRELPLNNGPNNEQAAYPATAGAGAAQFAELLIGGPQAAGEAPAARVSATTIETTSADEPGRAVVPARAIDAPRSAARRRVRRDELREPAGASIGDAQDEFHGGSSPPMELPPAPSAAVGGGRSMPAMLPR